MTVRCNSTQHSLEPTQILSKRPQFYRGQLANFFIIFFAHSFVNGIVYGYIGVMTFLDSCVVTFQDGILKGETILMIYPLDQLKLKTKTKTKIFFAGVNENSMTFFIHFEQEGQENRRVKKVFFFKVYNKVKMLSMKTFGFYFQFLVSVHPTNKSLILD